MSTDFLRVRPHSDPDRLIIAFGDAEQGLSRGEARALRDALTRALVPVPQAPEGVEVVGEVVDG